MLKLSNVINKPPMTGNGTHTIYKNGDDWGMLQMALFLPLLTGPPQYRGARGRWRRRRPNGSMAGKSSGKLSHNHGKSPCFYGKTIGQW